MTRSKKGFTLMEMLIVIAIIVILIAIAIPTFASTLERARETADAANIRSAYAEAMVKYLNGDNDTSTTSEKMTQTIKGWDYVTLPDYLGADDCKPTKGQVVTVTVEDDNEVGYKATCTAGAASTTDDSNTTADDD